MTQQATINELAKAHSNAVRILAKIVEAVEKKDLLLKDVFLLEEAKACLGHK